MMAGVQAETTRPPEWRYRGTVTKIVDGDTIDVAIRYDVGFDRIVAWVQRLRLARIDAPEQRGETLEAGRAATAFLKSVVPPGSIVEFVSAKGGSFGRYIADVWRLDVCVNDLLVAEGHAVYRDY